MIVCTCCGLPPATAGGHTESSSFLSDEVIITCGVCERLQKLGLVDQHGALLVEVVHHDED